MTVTPWTPAEIDQLRKLVAEGKINREIAAIMGRGLSSVVGARFRNGLRGSQLTWSEDSIRHLAELRAEGRSRAEIADAMGCPATTIKGALERFGLMKPSATAPRAKVPTTPNKLAGPASARRPYDADEMAWARANYDEDRQAKLICAIHHGAKLRTVFEDQPVREARPVVRAEA